MRTVATDTGISYDKIAKWVQGKGFPKIDDYKIITAYFGEDKDIIGNSSNIPLVDAEAIAGNGNFITQINEVDVIDKYRIPEFRDIDFMIKIKGSSMYPKYSAGDTVACRVLNDPKFIQWNKTYVIGTREQGILCKRLKPSKKEGYYLVVSDNKEYDPFDIPISELTGIALVVGVVRLE